MIDGLDHLVSCAFQIGVQHGAGLSTFDVVVIMNSKIGYPMAFCSCYIFRLPLGMCNGVRFKI
jgi:hypothetical protein